MDRRRIYSPQYTSVRRNYEIQMDRRIYSRVNNGGSTGLEIVARTAVAMETVKMEKKTMMGGRGRWRLEPKTTRWRTPVQQCAYLLHSHEMSTLYNYGVSVHLNTKYISQ